MYLVKITPRHSARRSRGSNEQPCVCQPPRSNSWSTCKLVELVGFGWLVSFKLTQVSLCRKNLSYDCSDCFSVQKEPFLWLFRLFLCAKGTVLMIVQTVSLCRRNRSYDCSDCFSVQKEQFLWLFRLFLCAEGTVLMIAQTVSPFRFLDWSRLL